MVELTYEELKKGLICCTVARDCANCPLYLDDDFGPSADCTYTLMTAAMNYINVLEKDLTSANKRADDQEEFAQNISKEIDA